MVKLDMFLEWTWIFKLHLYHVQNFAELWKDKKIGATPWIHWLRQYYFFSFSYKMKSKEIYRWRVELFFKPWIFQNNFIKFYSWFFNFNSKLIFFFNFKILSFSSEENNVEGDFQSKIKFIFTEPSFQSASKMKYLEIKYIIQYRMKKA